MSPRGSTGSMQCPCRCRFLFGRTHTGGGGHGGLRQSVAGFRYVTPARGRKVGAAGTGFWPVGGHRARLRGALQFMGLDENAPDGESGAITGELVNESAIERLLQGLSQAPLGLSRDVDFQFLWPEPRRKQRCSGTRDSGGSRRVPRRPRIYSKADWPLARWD